MTAVPLKFVRKSEIQEFGISSWQRRLIKSVGNGETSVPCGNCTACCEGLFSFIPLHPTVDDLTSYQHHWNADRQQHVLDLQDNGSCIYFQNGRCSIYERRPLTCRTYDCRLFLLLSPLRDQMPPEITVHIDVAAERFRLVEKEPSDRGFIEKFLRIFGELTWINQNADLVTLMSEALAYMYRFARDDARRAS